MVFNGKWLPPSAAAAVMQLLQANRRAAAPSGLISYWVASLNAAQACLYAAQRSAPPGPADAVFSITSMQFSSIPVHEHLSLLPCLLQVCLVGSNTFSAFGAQGTAEYVAMRHFPHLEACCQYLREVEGKRITG